MTTYVNSKPQMVYQENTNTSNIPVLRELPDGKIRTTLNKKVTSLAEGTIELKQTLNKLEKEWKGWPIDNRYTVAKKEINAKSALMLRKLEGLKEVCNLVRKAGFVALDLEIDLIYLNYKLDKLNIRSKV